MAIKRLQNGTYVVTSKKQAVEALEMMQELSDEVMALLKEHGITEMQDDAVELKKAVTRWAVENEVEQIQCEGFHATLIKQPYDGHYVATADDVGDSGATPLRKILKKKFKPAEFKEVWNRITKRVIDAEALDEVVQEGILDVDEIAPSYTEKQKSPYLRTFPDG